MSLNAIPASLASLALTTNSSITSADVLPGDFADLLAAQTLQAPSLVGVDTQVSSEPSESNDTPNLGIIFAEESQVIDPAALAGLVGIPPFNSPVGNGTKTQAPPEFLDKIDFAPGSNNFAGNRLLSEKDGHDGMKPPATNTPLNSSVFGDFEQQLALKKTDAANFAVESSNSPPPSASFETLISNKAIQSPATGAHTQVTVNPSLISSAWPGQFSEKIVWLAKNEQQSAQININPPQLGPIQITLNLNGDQMNAAFSSPHAEVRQAIESALPQLREMLSTAGISLGDTNVGANFARQNQDSPFQGGNKTQSLSENAILPADEDAANIRSGQVLLKGRGLVDLFA